MPDLSHLMVDIESAGINVNAPVLAIGACYFDPDTGELGREFYGGIDMEDAFRYGRPSGETMKWWLGQSEEARNGIIKGRNKLELVLTKLAEFYGDSKACVWGNGATFDISILEYAYQRCLDRKAPWDFWLVRDCRTIKDVAAPLMREPPSPFQGTAHNALDDARHQAVWVSQMWSKLRRGEVKPKVPTVVDDLLG